MTTTSPAAWHADPFGRFQFRYWDGTCWTDQVATQGQQATDPPTGEVIEPDRAVFEAARLTLVYAGEEAGDGWPVYAGDTRVATLGIGDRFLGPDDYFLTDASGRLLLQVRSTRSLGNPGFHVLDPQSRPLGVIGGRHLNTRRRSNYDLVDARRQLHGRVELTTSRHEIEDGVVSDTSGRPVARLVQGRERTGFLRGRAWFTLERDPALAEPMRTLLVAAPLAIHNDLTQRTDIDPGGSSWSPL